MSALLLLGGLLGIAIAFAQLQHKTSIPKLIQNPLTQAQSKVETLKSLSSFHLDAPDVGGSLKVSLTSTSSFGFLSEQVYGDAEGLTDENVQRVVSHASDRDNNTGSQITSGRTIVLPSTVETCRHSHTSRGEGQTAKCFTCGDNSEERAAKSHTATPIPDQALTPKSSRKEQKNLHEKLGRGHEISLNIKFDEQLSFSKYPNISSLKKSNARSSVGCSPESGGSSEGIDYVSASGLDSDGASASRTKELLNGALGLTVKQSKFMKFFGNTKPKGGLSMDMKTGNPKWHSTMRKYADCYGRISDRDEKYDNGGSRAGRSAVDIAFFSKTSEEASHHDPDRWQQHGQGVFVPCGETVVLSTLQAALEQLQAKQNQSLVHNFRDAKADAEPEEEAYRVGELMCDDFTAYNEASPERQHEANGSEGGFFPSMCPRAIVADILVDDEPSSVSRMRLLEAGLLDGQRLRLQRVDRGERLTPLPMRTSMSVSTSTNMERSRPLILDQPDSERMQPQTPLRNQAKHMAEAEEARRTTIDLSNSRDAADEPDHAGDEAVEDADASAGRRILVYDAPWLLTRLAISPGLCAIPFSLAPPTTLPTPPHHHDASDTALDTLDDSIRYSPSVREYRKAQLHHATRSEKAQTAKARNLHCNNTSKVLQSLSEIMKQRTSRQERMGRSQLQTPTYTSIFELAKTAQARVRGMEDPFVVSKKQRQYIEIAPIEEYEPSSPSDSSDAEGWLSDLSDDVRDAREEECKSRAAHRAAALAMLEGRAPPPVEDVQPIFRSARMEYDDHVEAEHGQLHLWSPKAVRPATRIQSAIQDWDTKVVADKFQAVDERLFGLGITIPEQAGANDVLDWLNSDSPVDLLNGRPVFYYQPSAEADGFWNEMSLDEFNAEAMTALPLP